MFIFTSGDILQAGTEAIVNTVNCVGIMGRGIALQFKNAYPANFKAYKLACDRGAVEPGKMFIFDSKAMLNPRYIINFPTKRHWRGKSKIVDIEAGLIDLREQIVALDIRSIAIPPLGSGLGGLDWNEVRALIMQVLDDLPDVEVQIFEPHQGDVTLENTKAPKIPDMTEGRALLVSAMDRYLGGLLDPEVTLLELHKLAYFIQRSGQDMRLQFKKAEFGPYTENLRHSLRAMEGYMVAGYQDGGDSPFKRLTVVPGAKLDADKFLANNELVMARLGKVAALVDGFETPFGMELLSTVHWVMAEEGAVQFEEVLSKIRSWNSRKLKFSDRQIELAFERLKRFGWA
jgi:O-acetyl-ADP-ribose deacetylase (regulator of RNase III)